MTEVSIILPTYNRADTLPRALSSVLQQRFGDWELIVVDDGSTDDTAALFEETDPRVRLIRQANQGCYAARNAGIDASIGRLVAFLDSDDEWLPHYLELAVAYMQAHPDDQFVMTEFWDDFGDRSMERQDHALFSRSWPAMAQAIGSRALDLPADETDDYLRVYEFREPVGAWGRDIAADAGVPKAFTYHGRIFRHFRWGHFGWLPTTLVTRRAIESVGKFLGHYRTAADYRFLALLSREYRANMIAVPGAIKHHAGEGGRALAEDHLAAGRSNQNKYRYAAHRLPLFDEFFRDPSQPDPENERIRGLYQLYAGRTALELGMPSEAAMHLREAVRTLPEHRSAYRWLLLLRIFPSGKLACGLYRWTMRLRHLGKALWRGDLSLNTLLRKASHRLFGAALHGRE